MEKVIAIVFRAKHWQIFAIFVLLSVAESTAKISAVGGIIIDVASTLIHFAWILLLGYGLSRIQNDPSSIRFWIFLGTGLQLVASSCLVKLLGPEITEAMIENKIILVTLIAYSIVTLAIVFEYPARTLKLLEAKGDIDIDNYFVDILRLIFWPVGIWNIQPRISNLAEGKNLI